MPGTPMKNALYRLGLILFSPSVATQQILMRYREDEVLPLSPDYGPGRLFKRHHIMLPSVLLILRKHDPFRCRPGAVLRDVKHIRPTKPMLVHQVILSIADPGRGKHFRFISGAAVFLLMCLCYTRLNQLRMNASDQAGVDLLCRCIKLPMGDIITGCPDNVLICRSVF